MPVSWHSQSILFKDPYQGWHSSSASGGSNFENFKNAGIACSNRRGLNSITKRKSKSIGAGRNWFMKNSRLHSCITRCSQPHSASDFETCSGCRSWTGYDLTTWLVPKASLKYKNETAGEKNRHFRSRRKRAIAPTFALKSSAPGLDWGLEGHGLRCKSRSRAETAPRARLRG